MLESKNFVTFYQEITGYEPFPWQANYAAKLCRDGWSLLDMWSDQVSMPTGSGKTEGIILPWLFSLACQLEQERRTQPLRLFWTVDRRIIVDTVHRLGEKLKEKLDTALPGSVCFHVAKALRKTGSEVPFQVVKMRGGVFMDPGWAVDPRTPTLISTTVDQVGSALLFRKYGSRNRVWPVFAALAANEAALALDESHLSQPFVDTVGRIKEMHPTGIRLIDVSATGRVAGSLTLSEEDKTHPILGPRLRCSKQARLVDSGGSADLVKHLVSEAKTLGEEGYKLVAIVCNQVKTARQVHTRLRKGTKADAVLFTGRSRQFDRDSLTEKYLPYLEANPNRPQVEKTLYVVSTQCIEAGADFDFDAMVTECAPLDSLIQRAGRLGRLGDRGVALTIVGGVEKDPVYEGQAIATWEWLKTNPSVNFSWEGQQAFGAKIEELRSPRGEAPLLSKGNVRTLSHTSPPSENAPTLERFLHGYQHNSDVTVLWRADLPDSEKDWATTVGLCPPVSGETMELPIWTLREFLVGSTKKDALADVAVDQGEETKKSKCEPILVWKGLVEDSLVLHSVKDIRPGDVVVLPSSRGGCDEFGWTGDPKDEPEDLANKVLAKVGKLRCRLHPHLFDTEGLKTLHSLIAEDELTVGFLREFLSSLEETQYLAQIRVLKYEAYPDGKGVVVFDPQHRHQTPRDDADEASNTPNQVLLNTHLKDVRHWAGVYGASLLQGKDLVEDLKLAGLLHDLGKAEPRWQDFIYGGRRSNQDPAIAKSTVRTCYQSSSIPRGYRHEFGSLMVAEDNGLLDLAQDPSLVAYLMATHHGLGRPFAPPLFDDSPKSYQHQMPDGTVVMVTAKAYPYATVDGGWPDRSLEVMHQHNPWKLAYLELILRMADWRASSEERKTTNA